MTDLASLIARLEAAEGPSRELDWAIREHLGGAYMPLSAIGVNDGCYVRRIAGTLIDVRPGDHSITSGDTYLPRYTASLDSAISLVPEGWYWRCGDGDGVPARPKPWAQVFRGNYRTIDGKGATVSAALTAAALKARAQGRAGRTPPEPFRPR